MGSEQPPMRPFRWRAIGESTRTRPPAMSGIRSSYSELGAKWAGGNAADPPVSPTPPSFSRPPRDRARGAEGAQQGGTLVLGGIHMSPIPSFSYDLLYGERVARIVANNTRQDGEDSSASPPKSPFARGAILPSAKPTSSRHAK